jgi:flagellar biosynthesis anti-sigma factor FlgM
MKINDFARLSGLQAYQGAGRTKGKPASPQTADVPRDGVSISQEAFELARESQVDPSRAERISDVKKAIANGAYRVEASAVVRKMLEAYGEF